MTAQEPGLIQACEERIINCWPAAETLIVGDFVVRFAHGYSGRANSATPLRAGADLDGEALDHIEALYRRAGQPPIVRVTPLAAPGLAEQLEARRYRLRDASHGLILPIDRSSEVDEEVRLAACADSNWLEGVSRLQGGAKRNPAHLAAIVGRIRVPAGFAALGSAGAEAGFGMTAVDRGMAEIGSIIVDPAARGQGVGRRIVAALIRHARQEGAHAAFLQVDVTNSVAIRLYERLGFQRLYSYRTMALTEP